MCTFPLSQAVSLQRLRANLPNRAFCLVGSRAGSAPFGTFRWGLVDSSAGVESWEEGDGGRGRGTGIGERGTVKQSFPQRESARSDPSEQREANKKKASSTRTQIGRLVSRGLDGGLLGTRSRHMQNVRARPRIHLPLHLLRPRIINSSSEPTNRTRLHDSSRSTPRDCQGHGEKAASPALRHPGPQRCPDYTAIKT